MVYRLQFRRGENVMWHNYNYIDSSELRFLTLLYILPMFTLMWMFVFANVRYVTYLRLRKRMGVRVWARFSLRICAFAL